MSNFARAALRVLLAGLFVVALPVSVPVPALAADLAPLRQALVDAVKAKDAARVLAAAEALVKEGSTTSAEILIIDGLLSGDPRAEEAVRAALAKVPAGPAFDWLCTSATEHERFEVRDQLVRVLAPRKERGAFAAVLTALFDESDGVKTSAILAVEGIGERRAIPHLVKALEREEERERELGQIASEIRRVLNLWTGQDLFGSGEFDDLWRQHEKELLDPENQVKEDPLAGVELITRGTSVEVKTPEFFGQELLTQHVVFVLDTSISMKAEDPPPLAGDPSEPGSGGKEGGTSVGGDGKKRGGGADPAGGHGSRQRLRRVQNELVRLVSDLPARFRFDILSYDQEVSEFSKGLQPATPETKRRAIAFVRAFDADGETWTDSALEKAFEVPGVRTIVLLSDGMPYRSDKPIHVPSLLDWVDERNRFEHIEIHTIGFAASSGEVGSFLKELARRNRGNYTEVP